MIEWLSNNGIDFGFLDFSSTGATSATLSSLSLASLSSLSVGRGSRFLPSATLTNAWNIRLHEGTEDKGSE